MGVGHETPTPLAPAVEPAAPHQDLGQENRPDLMVRAQVGTPGRPDDGDAPRGPNTRHLATVLETLLTGDLDDPEGAVAGAALAGSLFTHLERTDAPHARRRAAPLFGPRPALGERDRERGPRRAR